MSKPPELAAQWAFLEDARQSLDNALSLQQQQLLRLEERVVALSNQLREQVDRLDAVGVSAAESPPPHY